MGILGEKKKGRWKWFPPQFQVIILFKKLINVFIFGCTEFLSLRAGFSLAAVSRGDFLVAM